MSTPELVPTLLTVAAVHLAAVATPGANFLVVSGHALSHTRRVGLFTALGVATGSLVFITTGFLGLAQVKLDKLRDKIG
ncbi:MAG: LysE family transporter [bacterium]|nr:LysE family transporter [bacterium]